MSYASLPVSEAGVWLVQCFRDGRVVSTVECSSRRLAEAMCGKLLAAGHAAGVTRPAPGGAR